MARAPDDTIVQSPAFPPPQIVDSLGAGDTFTAAILHYLNGVKLSTQSNNTNLISQLSGIHLNPNESSRIEENNDIERKKITHNRNIESLEYSKTEFINQIVLQAAVTFACRTAGAKIGFRGYDEVQISPIE